MDLRITRGNSTDPLVFYLVKKSDHLTPATGLSPSVQISKACGPFAAPAGAVVELGNGWYQVAASSLDTNTVGPLILHATDPSSTADPVDAVYEVLPFPGAAPISQGIAGYPLRFLLISNQDNITGLTGATPTVLIAGVGQAFAAPAGAVREVGFGWYYVAPNAADVAIAGPLMLSATATGSVQADERFDVASAATASARDDDVYQAIVAILEGTGAFDGVHYPCLPEDRGEPASETRMAVIEPLDWDEPVDGQEFDDGGDTVRRARYQLTLFYREADEQECARGLDLLYTTAANALNGQSLAGVTFPDATRLRRGKWSKRTAPEQKLVCTGEFAYEVPAWAGHNTSV